MKHFIALMASLMLALPAMAADKDAIGSGHCCSDLEERVAELEATTVEKGNRKVGVIITGHVNVAIISHSGEDFALNAKSLAVKDDPNSESRVMVAGWAQVSKTLKGGFKMSFGLGNAVNGTFLSSLGLADPPPVVRESFVYLETGFGTISLGKQSTATDDFDHDLSQATHVWTLGNASLGAVSFSNGDGTRLRSVKYCTPSAKQMAGISVCAAWADDDDASLGDDAEYWDIAARYAGEFKDIRVLFGAGYRSEEGDRKIALASGSIMHTPSGLFFNIAAAQSDEAVGNDNKWYGFRVGFEKGNQYGKGTIFFDYSKYTDGIFAADLGGLDVKGIVNAALDEDGVEIIGGGMVQSFSGGSVIVGVGAQHVKPGSPNVDSATKIKANLKVRF